MRITSIVIENFKSISKISVSNLPNFVALVGENGIGKTSVFEAIGYVKSVIGPYSSQDSNWWQQRMKQHLPIKTGTDYMKIEIQIEPTTESEKKITGNKIATVGISAKLTNNNLVFQHIDSDGGSSLLRSWRGMEGVGAIEMIPANRIFPEGPVQLQSRSQNEEDFYSRRVSQLQNKYHDAKQQFVNFFIHDQVRPDATKLFPDAKKIIETLLGKKIKIDVDQNLFPKILVESKGGFVDVDSLSSGQRELFLTYVGIHATKLSNSIILFDEPDLHLHASLQDEVLKYLIKMSESGNQVFIATHSLEMISAIHETNLFHLSEYSGSQQLQNLENEKDKLEIFRELGASKYTFVNFKKIVFLEGPSDYTIFHKATPTEYGLKFHQASGISNLTPEILENASEIESFYMIRDRDFFDDEKISSLESKYHKKIRYLKRRHIENYILDSDELFEIYQKHGNGKLASKNEMLDELYKISEQQLEQTIVDYYLAKRGGNTYPSTVPAGVNDTAEQVLTKALSTTANRLNTDVQEISTKIPNIRNELKNKWKSDWLVYCSGKQVLSKFGETFFSPSKSLENLRELVSIKWDERKKLPIDIEGILKDIVGKH